MNKTNYQKELDKVIDKIVSEGCGEGNSYKHPSLLMHSCCAPCSSYCMEYLRNYFDITVFYYNPNISPEDEYYKRVEEEKRLISEYNRQVEIFENQSEKAEMLFAGEMLVNRNTHRINIIEGEYKPDAFYEVARGYEKCEEGGERCARCFELRLSKSFEIALQEGCEYVTSTLTISPLKNAQLINEIGIGIAKKYMSERTDTIKTEEAEIKWLPSDFKKKNGYKRSIELSNQFGLYRQNFCGCAFSRVHILEDMV